MMNCEEFGLRGLDIYRAGAGAREAAEAAAHANICAHCGALLESWREVRDDLQLLREATRADSAPARVEMRLKQELRTRRELRVPLSTMAISAWVLAAAAVLFGVVSWGLWQRSQRQESATQEATVPREPTPNQATPDKSVSAPDKEEVQRAEHKKTSLSAHSDVPKDDDGGKFTLLPGSVPAETEEAAIVRVRMQRGALGALGFPVNQERAGEWIQVDLLVGNDGLPQAVRLVR